MKFKENIVEYRDFGVVKYVYNRKARNFTIRINQKGDIRVTIPRFGSLKQAETYVFNKKQWIETKVHSIKHQNSKALTLKEGEEIIIRGKSFILETGINGRSPEILFWALLLKEAKLFLPGRVREIAERKSLPYKDLKIKKMKSRWGSCSSKNSINLNSWLLMLPDHLIDYVILHELAHTVHKNHSPRFWNYLDTLSNGQAKSLRKELKQHRILCREEA